MSALHPAGPSATADTPASSPVDTSTASASTSNVATTTTINEEDSDPERVQVRDHQYEQTHNRRRTPVRAQSHYPSGVPRQYENDHEEGAEQEDDEDEDGDSDDDEEDDDDDDEEEEEEAPEEGEEQRHVNTPRPGLPSFWYALRRLNIREPRSIIHSFNFFRWHVIVGIFVPLITAGIFCACNTDVKFAYIDALFMCTSALTLTGLSSILLGDMSFGQQFILYLLLQFGSIQFVSILVLFVRRSTFSKKFDPNRSYWPHKSIIMKDEEFNLANGVLQDPNEVPQLGEDGFIHEEKRKRRNRRRRMMRREKEDFRDSKEDSDGKRDRIQNGLGSPFARTNAGMNTLVSGDAVHDDLDGHDRKKDSFQLKRMNSPLSMQSNDYASHPIKKRPTQVSETIRLSTGVEGHQNSNAGNSTSTSAVRPLDKPRQRMRPRTSGPVNTRDQSMGRTSTRPARTGTNLSSSGATSRRSGGGAGGANVSVHAHPHQSHHQSARGGFPNPIQAIFSEGVYQLRKRTTNRSSSAPREFADYESGLHGPSGRRGSTGVGGGMMPRRDTGLSRFSGLRRVGTRLTTSKEDDTIAAEAVMQAAGGETANGNGEPPVGKKEDTQGNKPARQLSLPASAYRFGRNSTVRDLSREAHQKLAQLEISGMTLLMYIIIIWWIGLQLIFVIVWSPYFEAGHFDSVFQQYNPDVSRTWFSVFQSASMLNNSGLSLVDGSLTPFRTCYVMLVPGVFLMVIGNLGYPISLRFTIWLLHSCLRVTSKLRFITSFMLAHPRRIFYYIFPPYETQALFLVVMLLTAIDWGCFFLLDVGFTSPVFSISRGTAVLSGLVQSVAVRSAGFYTVPLYQVAPALDMLYLFMMAFCVYPLALAIRATNVYEERSLGIHNDETTLKTGLVHLRREKGYSKFHLREQLAYDVWYILLAYWLICIVERNNIGITGADPAGSIDMFAILFEVTSAYANVGFSIGSPTVDTSISGSLRHLSKLILCATMIRGRTRGLPVLVDRAVLTPRQLERYGDPADGGGTDDDATNDDERRKNSQHVA